MKTQTRKIKMSLSLLLFGMLVLTATAQQIQAEAQIWTTDAYGNPVLDYAPTDTVYINGSGFDMGTAITVFVAGPDGWLEPLDGKADVDAFDSVDSPYARWELVGSDGFIIEYYKGWCGGEFFVHVQDKAGNAAETMFTDAPTTHIEITDLTSCYDDGTATTSFIAATDDIYAKITTAQINGAGDNPSVDVYVVDSPTGLHNNDTLIDVSGGVETKSYSTVTTEYFKIWDHTTTSAGTTFYIVLDDLNKGTQGTYDNNIDIPFGPFTITDEEPPGTVTITITSSPTGSGFVEVDSTAYDTPHDFDWEPGSTHTISANSPVSGGAGIQYVFTSWSDSGTQSHDYITPDASATVTANYQTQYYLTVNDGGHGAAGGEGWYPANTTAYATISPLTVAGDPGVQYVFAGWTGDASGSGSPSDDITMDGPKTATATWTTQYYLTLATNPPGLPAALSGEGWYDAEDDADISTDSLVSDGGFWYIFTGWTTGDMSEIADPSATVTTVYMDKPKTVTANYRELPKSAITAGGCPFDKDEGLEGQQFRLIFTPDITNLNSYKLNASNPGQFFYNIFYVGTPGTTVGLDIDVPDPFVTQGAMPVHIYANVSFDGDCFVPEDEIGVVAAQTNNNPDFLLSVEVPESGLVYVRIHLDYGLKKTYGYSKNAENDAIDSVTIENLTEYDFIVSGDMDDTQTIQNENVFKHDPGFAGLVTDSEDTPIPGQTVVIYAPDGSLLASVETDEDGFYFYYYKHKGKAADYTITADGQSKTVSVKANQMVMVDFP